jgi:PIN domain nuclease of toxin-antitoxin system
VGRPRLISGLPPSSRRRRRTTSSAEFADHTGPLLLDTHIWIWYLEGVERAIEPPLRALLDRCAAGAGLLVSDISSWEVGVKCAKGKLRFSVDPAIWLEEAVAQPGLRSLPVSRDALLHSTRLPGTPPGDPVDRILVATAQLDRIPLVTADIGILEYAGTISGVRAVDARASR